MPTRQWLRRRYQYDLARAGHLLPRPRPIDRIDRRLDLLPTAPRRARLSSRSRRDSGRRAATSPLARAQLSAQPDRHDRAARAVRGGGRALSSSRHSAHLGSRIQRVDVRRPRRAERAPDLRRQGRCTRVPLVLEDVQHGRFADRLCRGRTRTDRRAARRAHEHRLRDAQRRSRPARRTHSSTIENSRGRWSTDIANDATRSSRAFGRWDGKRSRRPPRCSSGCRSPPDSTGKHGLAT